MVSPFLIKYSPAIPPKSKRESSLQEGIRHLRNIGKGIPPEEVMMVMSKFANSLRISGVTESGSADYKAFSNFMLNRLKLSLLEQGRNSEIEMR